MDYSIGEFSKLTGLGIHTLRYYEQEGLLEPRRDSGDRRRYSQGDLAWVEFIKRLKGTGMPLREIRRYAKLRAEGDGTLRPRMELLMAHRQLLDRRLEELREHRARLEEKIDFYRRAIEKARED